MSVEEVLLILNSMVYTSTLDEKIILDKKGWINESVTKIINDPKLIEKPSDEIATAEEWEALKETVNQNKDYFSNIKVVDAESVSGAQRNIAFKNENTNEIYITFRGTGSEEWHDNAFGGDITITETMQQINALDFVNRVADNPANNGYAIITSGHSKGGNKAAFTAILSDRVSAAYSFDGQGMGDAFLIKYREQILQNQHKITSISNQNDFVHVLFTSVAGTLKFTDTPKSFSDILIEGNALELMRQHSPFTMFEVKGKTLTMRTMQGVSEDEMATFIANISALLQDEMSVEDYEIFTHLIMHNLETSGCGLPEFEVSDIPKGFYIRLGEHLKHIADKMDIEIGEFFAVLSIIEGFINKDMSNASGLQLIISYFSSKYRNRYGKSGVHTIVVAFNENYKKYVEHYHLVRDFSQTAQDAVYACLEGHIEYASIETNKIPGWNYVADVLARSGFDDIYSKVTVEMRQFNEYTNMSKKQYQNIIKNVYQVDSEHAKKIRSSKEMLHEIKTIFQP